jgi:predicted GIY-YIG superfamily endonuclease
MGRPRKHSFEKCINDAKNYETKKDWEKASPKMSSAAHRHGWFLQCTEHMKPAKKGAPIKWTKEKCYKSAKNYSNMSEWQAADAGAASAAKRYRWINEVTTHFEQLGNQYRRLLYICRIRRTQLVYVGLTLNFKKRKRTHLASKRFKELIQKHGAQSLKFIKLTNLMDADDAAKLENVLIEKYKTRNFHLLNDKIGGGLGASPHKWTYKAVFKDASNYEYVGEWSLNSHAAYTAALEKNWIDQLVENGAISRKVNKKGFLTKNKIIQTAKSSKSRKEWRTNHRVAYDKAVELGLHKDPSVVEHFKSSFKYKGQDELIRSEVAKYKSLKEFRAALPSLYVSLKKYKLLRKFTSSLQRNRKRSPWTKEEIICEALKHQNKTSFQKLGKGAYAAAKKLKCFDEATKHMIRPKSVNLPKNR